MAENVEYATYADVKRRLDEIVEAVSDDDLPMDEALSLYEEASKLGLVASDLIERDMEERRAEQAETAASDASEEAVASDGDVAQESAVAPSARSDA